MKKPKRVTLLLYGLCAVAWTFRTAFGVVRGEYVSDSASFLLNALIALIWLAAFIRWTLKYRSDKEE